MIGMLKGTVDEVGEDHAVIDVHGVSATRQRTSAARQVCS
mgnify:CR=1 FL=1